MLQNPFLQNIILITMKLKESFVACETGENVVLISVDHSEFSGMVKGNKTTMFILDLLKNETSEDEIVSAMLQKFDAAEEKIRSYVEKVLGLLNSVNALEM